MPLIGSYRRIDIFFALTILSSLSLLARRFSFTTQTSKSLQQVQLEDKYFHPGVTRGIIPRYTSFSQE